MSSWARPEGAGMVSAARPGHLEVACQSLWSACKSPRLSWLGNSAAASSDNDDEKPWYSFWEIPQITWNMEFYLSNGSDMLKELAVLPACVLELCFYLFIFLSGAFVRVGRVSVVFVGQTGLWKVTLGWEFSASGSEKTRQIYLIYTFKCLKFWSSFP